MDVRKTSRRLIRALLLALLIAAPCVVPVEPQAKVENKRVLILFSSSAYLPTQTIVERAMRSTLDKGLSVPVEIYAEYLDVMRTGVDRYEEELVNLLRLKYADTKFDVVFAITDPVLRMVSRNRADLFGDTPVVFLTLDPRSHPTDDFGANVTGVWGEIGLKADLDLALALHPETKRVAVVTGVSDWDNYWREQTRQVFREYEPTLEFNYLNGLSIPELKDAVAGLPPNSIVIFVTNLRDTAGNTYDNRDVLNQISPVSKAPIYGVTDAQLGSGIVGGRLLSLEQLGTEGAELGLRLIAGEKVESIPPRVVRNVPMFDWRQLHRWGISEANLPEGSVIQFRQPSVWDEYKWYAVALLAAVIIETLLIVFLVYLRLRRRQAEAENVRLSGRLEEIVANVPGIVWESRTDPAIGGRRTTFISDYVKRMLGYTPEEWLKQPPGFGLELVPEEDRERVRRESNEVIETGKEMISEFRWQTKDGRIRWVENYLSPLVDDNSRIVGLRGVALDITDRKLAQETGSASRGKG
jgi:PAS domain S-box-containing protein